MEDGKMNKVIHEDNHLLIVEKPRNILVQGDETKDTDLLSELKSVSYTHLTLPTKLEV